VLQLQCIEHGAHDADAPADHGAQFLAHTGQGQVLDVPGLYQLRAQLVQRGAADFASGVAHLVQGLANRPRGAGRTEHLLPVQRLQWRHMGLQGRLGRRLGGFKAGGGQGALVKKALGPGHAADGAGDGGLQRVVAADADFGGAPANVDHQAWRHTIGQQAADTLVNECGFTLARDQLHRTAQDRAGL